MYSKTIWSAALAASALFLPGTASAQRFGFTTHYNNHARRNYDSDDYAPRYSDDRRAVWADHERWEQRRRWQQDRAEARELRRYEHQERDRWDDRRSDEDDDE